jgi:hypothetical protein
VNRDDMNNGEHGALIKEKETGMDKCDLDEKV